MVLPCRRVLPILQDDRGCILFNSTCSVLIHRSSDGLAEVPRGVESLSGGVLEGHQLATSDNKVEENSKREDVHLLSEA